MTTATCKALLFAVTAAVASLNSAKVAACTAWADEFVAWNPKRDLAVVARWPGRPRVPSKKTRGTPESFILYRISTGADIAHHGCESEGTEPPKKTLSACDWKAAFQAHGPTAEWTRDSHPIPPKTLRIRKIKTPGTWEFVLQTRTQAGWRTLQWLDFVPRKWGEVRSYRVRRSIDAGKDLVFFFTQTSRGANCAYQKVQFWRAPKEHLAHPDRAERKAYLLENPRVDAPLGYWRTIAMLGPIPKGHLLEALYAAETEWHAELGARWWAQSTRQLRKTEISELEKEIRKDPGHYLVRNAIEKQALSPAPARQNGIER